VIFLLLKVFMDIVRVCEYACLAWDS